MQEEVNEAIAKIEGAGIVYKLMIEQLREELEQYRALGTVEGFQKALDSSLEYYIQMKEYKAKLQEYEAIGTVEELKEVLNFKKYFDALYGEGLEIANWHKNGDLEPFDSFYESALD